MIEEYRVREIFVERQVDRLTKQVNLIAVFSTLEEAIQTAERLEECVRRIAACVTTRPGSSLSVYFTVVYREGRWEKEVFSTEELL